MPAVLLAMGTFLLTGCAAQVFYTQVLPPPHAVAPRRVEDVQVFVVTPPTAPHVNVGLFQVTGGMDAMDSNAQVARLRAEAAARGCDAVVITAIEHQSSKDTRANVQGSCVVYDDPASATKSVGGCPAAPAPAPAAAVASPAAAGTASGPVTH